MRSMNVYKQIMDMNVHLLLPPQTIHKNSELGGIV